MYTSYSTLEIAVGPLAGGAYPLTVGGAGGDGRGALTIPSDAAFVEQLARLRSLDTDAALIESIGRSLFAALFDGEIRAAYDRARGALQPGQALRLTLDIAASEGDVAGLPWEVLNDPACGALALTDAPPLRYLPLPTIAQTLKIDLPLRVLLTAAQTPPPVAVARELDAAREALSRLGDFVEVVVEEHLTAAKLQDLLRQRFHVWHFVGHGSSAADGTGKLILEDGDGGAAPIDALQLGALLAGSGVRLALLSACDGARLGDDVLRGTAPALIRAGVPAVVAMQFAAAAESTRAFAAELYQTLGEGFPLDACVTEGRRAVAAISGTSYPDWATPALYSRSPETMLFDLPPLPKPACPYPGMTPFRPEDARFFFGREDEIEDMTQRLRVQDRLLVIGPSGSGKSSLVNAGLLPRLNSSSAFPPGTWLIKQMRPGDAPSQRLRAILDAVAAAQPSPPPASETGSQATAPASSAPRLLLLIDQFEELFTLARRDEQLRFVGLFQQLRARHDATILIAMRADFFPDLMTSALWPIDPSQRLEVAPLRGEKLRAAIERPATAVGVRIESGLVERLLADAADEPGSLPLIQETLVLLWDRMPHRLLTIAAYEDLGRDGRSGLAVAIATRADATMASLSAPQQSIARRIFLRLVQFGQGRADTRRQQPLDALRVANEDPASFDAVLKTLTDVRLLTRNSEARPDATQPGAPPAVVVDISHEALIRGWPAFQGWIAARRVAEETRRRIEEKFQEWDTRGRGDGGLLDAIELAEADRWMESVAGTDVGGAELAPLFEASRAELAARAKEIAEREAEREAARQRELDSQKALAASEADKRAQIQDRVNWLRIVTAAAIISLIAAVWGLWIADRNERLANAQRIEAETQSARAEQERAAAETEKQRANIERQRAEDAKDEAVSRAQIADSQSALVRGDVNGALALALTAAHAKVPLPQAQLAVDAAADVAARRVIQIDDRSVVEVDVLPDSLRAIAGTQSGDVSLWDLGTGQRIRSVASLATPLTDMALSYDGQTVFVALNDGTIRSFNLDDGAELRRYSREGWDKVNSVAVSTDGTLLAASSGGGQTPRIAVWRIGEAEPFLVLDGHQDSVLDLAFSADGTRLASAGSDNQLVLWSIPDGAEVGRSNEFFDAVTSVVFTPDGSRIIATSRDSSVRVWNVSSRSTESVFTDHTDGVNSAAVSPDGQLVASISDDRSARLWDVISARQVRRFGGHVGAIGAVSFAPDGRSFVTGGIDGTVRVWDVQSLHAVSTSTQPAALLSVAYAPDGRLAVVGGANRNLFLWDSVAGRVVRRFSGQADDILGVAFSHNGSMVASASSDQSVAIWDVASGQLLHTLKGHGDVVWSVAFSPDDTQLASAGDDGTAIMWDVARGTQIRTLEGEHSAGIKAVEFSPDGKTIATASDDTTVVLWDVGTGTFKAQLKQHDDRVFDLAWSPDGTQLLTGAGDATMILWDVAKAAPIRRFSGHLQRIRTVCFSEDGKLAVSGSDDRTVRVWDVASGQEIQRMADHSSGIWGVAISADSRSVLSVSDDATLRLWRVDSLADLIRWVKVNRVLPAVPAQ